MTMNYRTAQEISVLIGTTKRAVQVRAAAERWAFVTVHVRGGTLRLYPVQKLPLYLAKKIIRSAIKKTAIDHA